MKPKLVDKLIDRSGGFLKRPMVEQILADIDELGFEVVPKKKRKVSRNAESGKFASKKEVAENPKGTVSEKV